MKNDSHVIKICSVFQPGHNYHYIDMEWIANSCPKPKSQWKKLAPLRIQRLQNFPQMTQVGK